MEDRAGGCAASALGGVGKKVSGAHEGRGHGGGRASDLSREVHRRNAHGPPGPPRRAHVGQERGRTRPAGSRALSAAAGRRTRPLSLRAGASPPTPSRPRRLRSPLAPPPPAGGPATAKMAASCVSCGAAVSQRLLLRPRVGLAPRYVLWKAAELRSAPGRQVRPGGGGAGPAGARGPPRDLGGRVLSERGVRLGSGHRSRGRRRWILGFAAGARGRGELPERPARRVPAWAGAGPRALPRGRRPAREVSGRDSR